MMSSVERPILRSHFEPSFGRVFLVGLLIAVVLFVRPPSTNFVFDEQEALLANPYLRGADGLRFWDAFRVDFWGLPPGRTIGSYRPLPNLLWRVLLPFGNGRSPFAFLWLNLVVHALCTACLAQVLCLTISSQRAHEETGFFLTWIFAIFFACAAVSTEAVASAVGLADLLVGLSTIVSLWLLLVLGRLLVLWRSAEGLESAASAASAARRSTATLMGGLFLVLILGCFSKESMVGTLLFLPLFFWGVARHRESSNREILVGFVVVAALCGCALLVYLRVRSGFFPAKVASAADFVPGGPFSSFLSSLFAAWAPPVLPGDTMNNPLFEASSEQRFATAHRIFGQLFLQAFAPLGLCADSSFPRLLPKGWDLSAGLGAALVLVLLGSSMMAHLQFRRLSSGARFGGLFAFGLLCTYLPVSNAFVLLPTIRAERLFYTPTIFLVLLMGAACSGWWGTRALSRAGSHRGRRAAWLLPIAAYLILQGVAARLHACDYRDDLSFWRATAQKEPPSAKSLLNLGIMLGARGDQRARLEYTERAVTLSPDWAMGQIYLGDAHCRHGDIEAAREPYLEGLRLAPDTKALAALALQCLWERGAYATYRSEVAAIARLHPGSWLAFFVAELDENGVRDGGIASQYRPRRYNGAE